MAIVLSYQCKPMTRSRYSTFGYASAGVTVAMFMLPLLVLTASTLVAMALRTPTGASVWTEWLGKIVTAQMAMMVLLPLAGVVAGVAGVARKGRCPLAAACGVFNALVLASVLWQGA